MFFLAAKIFWFFVQPLNFSIVLAILATVLIAFGRRGPALCAAGFCALILGLSTWTSIGAVALQPLEEKYKRPELPAEIAGVIVLGGGFEGTINKVRGGYELNSGGDRFVEAAILARRFPQAKVLVTGGSGALVLDGAGDGETAPRLLQALGVEPGRLILENESRDTYENAVFSRRLVEPKEGETWVLVTSAFHMPRSMGLFRKAGFPVTPWPSDYRTTGQERFGLANDNPLDSLQTTTVALREWIGLAAYRLTGRTDELVP